MSNRTYTPVSLEEMKELLKENKGWRLGKNNHEEYIFSFPLSTSPHIVIKVCSSIIDSNISRECGKDAIRVFAVDTQNHKGYINTIRVFRIGTWRKNLVNAVQHTFKAAQARRSRERKNT